MQKDVAMMILDVLLKEGWKETLIEFAYTCRGALEAAKIVCFEDIPALRYWRSYKHWDEIQHCIMTRDERRRNKFKARKKAVKTMSKKELRKECKRLLNKCKDYKERVTIMNRMVGEMQDGMEELIVMYLPSSASEKYFARGWKSELQK